MCNERDRLIGFVYDECDGAERELMRRHIEECLECRREIAELRQVREDLLAWDLPAHQSVWRPFAPPTPVAWWRQVPAWAMAAAASLVFVAGGVGGVVGQALVTRAAASPADRQVAAVPVGLTSADLSASEQRVMNLMRAEFEGRLQLAAAHTTPVRVADAGIRPQVLGQIEDIQRKNAENFDLIKRMYKNFGQVKETNDARYQALQTSVADLKAIVLQQGR
jgi:hypothetical protein